MAVLALVALLAIAKLQRRRRTTAAAQGEDSAAPPTPSANRRRRERLEARHARAVAERIRAQAQLDAAERRVEEVSQASAERSAKVAARMASLDRAKSGVKDKVEMRVTQIREERTTGRDAAAVQEQNEARLQERREVAEGHIDRLEAELEDRQRAVSSSCEEDEVRYGVAPQKDERQFASVDCRYSCHWLPQCIWK